MSDNLIYDIEYPDGRQEKTLLAEWKVRGDQVLILKQGETWQPVANSLHNMELQSIGVDPNDRS